MKFNLIDLGPKIRGGNVTFKLHLPRIDREARVLVVGSFCGWEPEKSVSLKFDNENELWKGTLDDIPDGLHEYAYIVKTGSWNSNPSNDPYAKMTGPDGFSAFRVPQEKSARLDSFRPPSLERLSLYYLNLDDFNENFEGARNRVRYYLSQMGVNGVIFSPWYGCDSGIPGEKIPLHYFAPDYKYGTVYDLKVMINECHNANIAVIMDIDFSAVSTQFGINQLYPMFDNKPLLAGMDESGKKIYLDFNDELTGEFVTGVCRYWLDEFNVDGFRFLNCREYWDGGDIKGFAGVLKGLYEYRKKGQGHDIFLFAHNPGQYTREMISRSYFNGVENSLFFKSMHRMAENRALDPAVWRKMDINQMGVPEDKKLGEDLIGNTILNYCESDEHNSIIAKLGVVSGERDRRGSPVGDRKNHWWKTKSYYIAQFMAGGIPVIHNGQEIADNRFVPDNPNDRDLPRPIGWHFLADFAGKDMYRFHQKMLMLREKFPSVRSRNFYHYYSDPDRQLVVFKRYLDEETVVAAINFSNESYDAGIPFPNDGIWHEYLDDYDIKVENREALVKVPARYGCIFFQEL